ncbi:MAG TPA: transcriptional regulator [Phycisphaerae bacterium]|nr:transcriptional regulator [Phycisphaerae bacterium]
MATRTKQARAKSLPASFEELVRLMPPMAIRDDVHHQNTVEMIDRLMQIPRHSRGQANYLETLVELVEAYEARQHAIDLAKLSGLAMLRHVTEQAGMSASDLGRLLGVHPSMGSKLLKGDRHLTWEQAKILGGHFSVAPALFMES